MFLPKKVNDSSFAISSQAEPVGEALAPRATGNQENEIRPAKHAPRSAGSPR